MKFIKRKFGKLQLLILAVLIVGALLRIYNLNWDDGHFLHPDERLYVNASDITFPSSLSEFFLPTSPLNPDMFYYGSLPLYLYKSINVIFLSDYSFLISSRVVASAFSILTVIFIFLSTRVIFGKISAYYAAIIYMYMPGSIQHAHFNTTESILIFLLSLIIFLSLKIHKSFSLKNILLLAIVYGLAISTKVTGTLFLILPFISFAHFTFTKGVVKTVSKGVFFVGIVIIVFIITSPYQLIDWQQFIDEQSYMQGVILGQSKPPFTIIYEGTLAYLYPLLFVMPFIFGFATIPISLLGLLIIVRRLIHKKSNFYLLLIILVLPLIYFAWTGAWYAKFSRYYLLLAPFICIWGGYALARVKKPVAILFVLLIILNGISFLKIYLSPHTRIMASRWINVNIAEGSTIAGEHWDDNLPLPLNNTKNPFFNRIQLEVYNPDTKDKIETLSNQLSQSDYFITSSRRVYASILANNKQHPYTAKFYSLLSSGRLGYIQVEKFTNYPFFFSDDIADESFQSYDHPPVVIYKNVKRLHSNKIFEMLYE